MVTSRMTDPGTLAIHADALEDSSWHVRYTTLQTLRQLDPATLQHAGAIVARLEDSDSLVRAQALMTLSLLDPATLAQHAGAVVARLEDDGVYVCEKALMTLGQLDPATLAQHAGAVVARLEDDGVYVRQKALMALGKLDPATLAQPGITAAIADSILSGRSCVTEPAIEIFRALPKVITSNIDLTSADGRSRLIGRAAWYRCRLRLRWRRVALYWYALPYRPSGPGHARDVEAWERMSKRSRHG